MKAPNRAPSEPTARAIELERTTGFEPATLTLATKRPAFTLSMWCSESGNTVQDVRGIRRVSSRPTLMV